MGWLRRLLGGDPSSRPPRDGGVGDNVAWSDEEERAHELELARFEQGRTTDLIRRQQQYADRAWTPPAQGGPRRAGEDEDSAS
ncbi:MAG: hypothetical protein ACJ761_10880 [Chloroflexota bacterium]